LTRLQICVDGFDARVGRDVTYDRAALTNDWLGGESHYMILSPATG
jgi:hypothetical protein